MSSTKLNKADLKELLRSTMARYPHMTFDREFQEATLEDWVEDAQPVGLTRFTDGVKRARSYTEFFPHRSLIRKMIPEARQSSSAFFSELRDLERRKAAGEKFYTLADVLLEFCRRVESGEQQFSSDKGKKAGEDWVKSIRGQEKALAAKMLAGDEKKRGKSDFKAVGEIA